MKLLKRAKKPVSGYKEVISNFYRRKKMMEMLFVDGFISELELKAYYKKYDLLFIHYLEHIFPEANGRFIYEMLNYDYTKEFEDEINSRNEYLSKEQILWNEHSERINLIQYLYHKKIICRFDFHYLRNKMTEDFVKRLREEDYKFRRAD